MTRTLTHSITSYTIGFMLSGLLTLFSFLVAPSFGELAVVCILASAVAQLVVQLFFFLHLGRGQDAGWNISIFVFAILIISILMIGTLWIMHNLAHLHILTPSGEDLYERGVVAPENELH